MSDRIGISLADDHRLHESAVRRNSANGDWSSGPFRFLPKCTYMVCVSLSTVRHGVRSAPLRMSDANFNPHGTRQTCGVA